MATRKQEIDEFIEYLQLKNLSPKTIKDYLYYYSKIKLKHFWKNPKRSLRKLLSKYNNGVCRAFLNNYFEFYGRKYPVPKVTGRKKKIIRKVLSYNERKAYRKTLYLYKYEYGVMFDIMYYGALRREEVAQIKWKDFELNNYNFNEDKSCILTIHGKGNRDRKIIIPREVMFNLKQMLAIKGLDKFPEKEEYVFDLTPRQISYAFEAGNLITKMNVHPHMIRHTRATDIYNKKENIYHLMHYLGHSSVTTTELYVHPQINKILKDIEKITVFD